MPPFQNDPVVSVSNSISTPAVTGESSHNEGVRGVSHNGHGGVVGVNDWSGVITPPAEGSGMAGRLRLPPRPWSTDDPVISTGGIGVFGHSVNGIGVVGESTSNEGVRGVSHNPHGGVVGINDAPAPGGQGGWFQSALGEGVRGTAKNPDHAGVVGMNKAGGIGVFGTSETGTGVHGRGGHLAGFFEGDVKVTGNFEVTGNVEVTGNIDITGTGSDIRLINADCAEDFDVSGLEKVEPGTVMVLGNEGALSESQQAYDKRVAGVISGAGDYKPAIVLDSRRTSDNRQPIALMGKVFCKVDAQFGAIEVGDLLTTSPTPGHAMAVSEPVRAFGTIIGKALRPLSSGKGLIPILVALQ